METSSPNFITCDELRTEIAKCPDDINKRILIIDVRRSNHYERCHLCLDKRNDISSIKTKMRVMNIDPDLLSVCTAQKIMTILDDRDLAIFKKRKDATDVIIIDEHTDDIEELLNRKSKASRIINGLTKYDNQIEERIVVPAHILRGGLREWRLKYPHFTTDPTYDPDSPVYTVQPTSKLKPTVTPTPQHSLQISEKPSAPMIPAPSPTITAPPILAKPSAPMIEPPSPTITAPPISTKPSAPILSLTTSSPIPTQIPTPTAPPMSTKPSAPLMISRPFVATTPPPSSLPSKPRFDRNLKPAINSELINAVQINIGCSPDGYSGYGKAMPTGLQNLGNTCFMNSVIQCLAYLPTLVDYFCSQTYKSHINFKSQSKGELALQLGALIEKLNDPIKHRYIEPKSFRESVVKHVGFAGNEQQDSHEFMMMLFEKLHHDLNIHGKEGKSKQQQSNGVSEQTRQLNNGNIKQLQKTNNDTDKVDGDDNNINTPRAILGYQFWRKHLEFNKSIISDLFEGISMSTLTCAYCQGQSNTFEVFNCLSLPLPSETSCNLGDCLRHFSNPERIEAAWECPRCKEKREAVKKIIICKLPQVFIIHLKRFSLDGRSRSKLKTNIVFPLVDLTVDSMNVLPQPSPHNRPLTHSRNTYNLIGVVNHYGDLEGGHYTAFCKLENQRWYTFDDSNVKEMRDADVCRQEAYLLFYGAV